MARRGATKKSLTHMNIPTDYISVVCRMDGLKGLSANVTSTEAALDAILDWLPVKHDVGWEIKQGDPGEVDYWRPVSMFSDDMTPADIAADVPGGFHAKGPNNGYMRIMRIYRTVKT